MNEKDTDEPPWCIEEKWRGNVDKCRNEIVACLNYSELLTYFDSHELLSQDEQEILLMDTVPRKDKVNHILKVLETTDKRNPYTLFVKCLEEEIQQQEGSHLGHQYLFAIIKGEPYATEDELLASTASRKSVRQVHRKELDDINLSSLVPVMYARNLITRDEMDMLLHRDKSHKAMIGKLLQILDTKGPLAYSIFIKCLGEEKSHCTHKELYDKIISRKRPHPENDDKVCSVPKRNPQRLQLEKPFCGKVYCEFMEQIQKCYPNSLWAEMERLAQKFILQNNDPQLKAMALIVKGYSLSYRSGIRENALKYLEEAQILAHQINGSNHYFLLARCKHIEATIKRYSGEDDKSLKLNEEAYELLYDCQRGDDASCVTYGLACARLEKLGNTCRSPPLKEINDISAYFVFCASYSRKGTPGLCASEARCLIRLAQLSLATTTEGKCWAIATPSDIQEAENYLKQVDVSSISRRCQALYYIIESDLFKSMDNTTKAIESTEKALKIVEESKLGAERHYAESRLQALKRL